MVEMGAPAVGLDIESIDAHRRPLGKRAERDAVDQKVMADPRLKGEMPFDGKRLIFGGFEMWLEM